MHINEDFNIVQAQGNCNPLFIVIKGKRTNAGHKEMGAKEVSEPMTRDEAIKLADTMQAEIVRVRELKNEETRKGRENSISNGTLAGIYGGDTE